MLKAMLKYFTNAFVSHRHLEKRYSKEIFGQNFLIIKILESSALPTTTFVFKKIKLA